MAAKRSGGDVPLPAAKRAALLMSTLDIGPACGEEDLNVKVLQVSSCGLCCTNTCYLKRAGTEQEVK